LENVKCTITEPCDKCTTIYDRKVDIEEYSAKFQTKIDPKDESDEPVFLIDKNENIDVKDMILQSITLEEPFIKKCEACSKEESDEEADDFDYLE
jgi:uncharacterized metal-binding protein YceD (DUF177 family)